jgi:prepilin-type N-terminal cleavage/methylation domain-containing protein
MRRQGFTLTELLISLAVLAIVSVYLTNMLTQQNRAYTVVDQVTEAQGSARALLDLIEREIRGTGALAPEGAAVCGIDSTAGSDVLFVTDADVLEYYDRDDVTGFVADGYAPGYDAGASISSGYAGSGTGEQLRLSSLAPDGKPFYDLDSDAVGDSDFRPGGAVIVVDPNVPSRGTACGVIVPGGVDLANRIVTVDFTVGAGNANLVGVLGLQAVPAHRFRVNAQNQLLRDGVALAEDVEDFQVAYFYDALPVGAENGELDNPALEYPGSEASGVTYEPDDWDNSLLREIRFGFVVRSSDPDPNLPGAIPQPLENHAPAAVPDGYRRRMFTGTVRPRNVGHRLKVVSF